MIFILLKPDQNKINEKYLLNLKQSGFGGMTSGIPSLLADIILLKFLKEELSTRLPII
jgi:hypothetical protein